MGFARIFNQNLRNTISGSPFTTVNVNGWKRLGKLPDAYGGNKIIEAKHYKELKNLLIFRIEGLDRNLIEQMCGCLSQFEENTKKMRRRIQKNTIKTDELAYKTLRLKEKSSLEYIMQGVKGNQIARLRKTHKRGRAKNCI